MNPGLTLNSAFLRPRSRGPVRLKSRSADAPLIDPNYWADPYDRRMSLQGLRMAREILQQPALRPFLIGVRSPAPDVTTDEQLAEYAFAPARPTTTPSGLRHGHGPMAVVDPDLRGARPRGPAGDDTSIMPRVPSSNTNAPTIMVGEKASDLVLGNRARAAARAGGLITSRRSWPAPRRRSPACRPARCRSSAAARASPRRPPARG